MQTEESTPRGSGPAMPAIRDPIVAWIAFGLFLIALLGIVGFISYQQLLRKPSNNVIKVNIDHGQTRHVLYLDREYLKDPNAPPREHVVIYAAYPSMLPCARFDVPGSRCMHVLIAPDHKTTEGEFIVEQWQLRKNRLDNGPGFDRFVGKEDDYEIYEALLSPKTGKIIRTYIFKDSNGNLVSDGQYGSARMLSGVPVRYGSSKGYQTTPKEMHKWIKDLLNRLTQEVK